MAAQRPTGNTQQKADRFDRNERAAATRQQNVNAAKGASPSTTLPSLVLSAAVADAVRTSLGPRGMDKMVSAQLQVTA